MDINQAVVEIEKLMMYRESMPEEGKLRNILEAVNTTTNSAMVQCLCVDCRLNDSCQFTKGKERYGCSVYYAQHQ